MCRFAAKNTAEKTDQKHRLLNLSTEAGQCRSYCAAETGTCKTIWNFWQKLVQVCCQNLLKLVQFCCQLMWKSAPPTAAQTQVQNLKNLKLEPNFLKFSTNQSCNSLSISKQQLKQFSAVNNAQLDHTVFSFLAVSSNQLKTQTQYTLQTV